MALRIIFMGTPEFSVPTLQALHAAGHEIVACYTQPPRPAGRRGLELVPSPVHQASDALNIPVFTPASLKSGAEHEKFAAHGADVAIVVAYGLLLPQAILDGPVLGCYNGHASLLPRWRGAAPIQRAIMAGDAETGVMIMKMEAGLDTGPVGATERIAITQDMTASHLHDRLMHITADLMVSAMTKLAAGDLPLVPQTEDGTVYADKISKSETRVDWSLPAEAVHRHIMGLSPFPGAWCEMELGGKRHRVKLLCSSVEAGEGAPGSVLDDDLKIACGEGAVRLQSLQRAGSKAMSKDEFLRGNALERNTVLD